MDKTQHLRERFYQGLKREIHQKLTPSYADERTPYVVLIKQTRELEAEFYPMKETTAKGATEVDPQLKEVIKTLECLEDQRNRRQSLHPARRPKRGDCTPATIVVNQDTGGRHVQKDSEEGGGHPGSKGDQLHLQEGLALPTPPEETTSLNLVLHPSRLVE